MNFQSNTGICSINLLTQSFDVRLMDCEGAMFKESSNIEL